MASSMSSRMRDGVDRNAPAYWDARFAEDGFAYGTEPNDFLRLVADRLPGGDALCLCEGEGRNATFLAQRGMRTTAMDFSAVALRKAEGLAAQRGLRLQILCCDLAGFDPGAGRWDVITMIFGQPDPLLRRALYARLAACLRPGGALVLETKVEEDAASDSRYPGSSVLCAELLGLDFAIARDSTRVLREGRYHDGEQRTAQILAFRPGYP